MAELQQATDRLTIGHSITPGACVSLSRTLERLGNTPALEEPQQNTRFLLPQVAAFLLGDCEKLVCNCGFVANKDISFLSGQSMYNDGFPGREGHTRGLAEHDWGIRVHDDRANKIEYTTNWDFSCVTRAKKKIMLLKVDPIADIGSRDTNLRRLRAALEGVKETMEVKEAMCLLSLSELMMWIFLNRVCIELGLESVSRETVRELRTTSADMVGTEKANALSQGALFDLLYKRLVDSVGPLPSPTRLLDEVFFYFKDHLMLVEAFQDIGLMAQIIQHGSQSKLDENGDMDMQQNRDDDVLIASREQNTWIYGTAGKDGYFGRQSKVRNLFDCVSSEKFELSSVGCGDHRNAGSSDTVAAMKQMVSTLFYLSLDLKVDTEFLNAVLSILVLVCSERHRIELIIRSDKPPELCKDTESTEWPDFNWETLNALGTNINASITGAYLARSEQKKKMRQTKHMIGAVEDLMDIHLQMRTVYDSTMLPPLGSAAIRIISSYFEKMITLHKKAYIEVVEKEKHARQVREMARAYDISIAIPAIIPPADMRVFEEIDSLVRKRDRPNGIQEKELDPSSITFKANNPSAINPKRQRVKPSTSADAKPSPSSNAKPAPFVFTVTCPEHVDRLNLTLPLQRRAQCKVNSVYGRKKRDSYKISDTIECSGRLSAYALACYLKGTPIESERVNQSRSQRCFWTRYINTEKATKQEILAMLDEMNTATDAQVWMWD